jgi:porin-like protein
MKMVKSLLLGSAAGLVAVAGAQAADLPVKAKPVQYVKICSLYGVGFYYIPGTDMCIKIGGWVRAEYGWGQNGSFAWGWANANLNNRATNNSDFRARGYITADARNQTEYGTVRGYIAVGLSENEHGGDVNASNSFSANRAFIQWAGFTFGRAQSFFDFYSSPATSYWGAFPSSDTGDGGWFVMAYTAQFGNGFSATISAEAPRKTQIVYIGDDTTHAGLGTIAPGGFGASGQGAYGGFQMPDVVANLRIDQAWGSAQVMGAVHQVNALYYNTTGADNFSRAAGHPDNKIGWVVGAGIKLNAPMIGQGDYFQAQVNYTQGALRYIFQTPNSNWGKDDGYQSGFGVLSDAVYTGVVGGTGTSAPTDLQLTTAWNVNAAYEHFWNPRWRTSIYGGYAQVNYNDAANAALCWEIGGVTDGCNMNWSTWWVGSRTQWNVTKDFYMGLDVLYSKMQSATWFADATGPFAINASGNLSGNPQKDVDNLSFRFRVHRDFYP